ncbi:hypothetical protein [Sabulibacter ruber]|uniref:hypothetical protein n=1 Tax=Sabulibacter ruber TaxID=2811901 RepID=UPI001A96B5C8|nr:hypothetical protein [Sabulibacter ruber]
MKLNTFLAALFFSVAITSVQPLSAKVLAKEVINEPLVKATTGIDAGSAAAAASPAASQATTETAGLNPAEVVSSEALGQEKPKKAQKQKGKPDQQETTSQKVKEVATAKRQEKPEKVSGNAEVNAVETARSSAGRPRSAARPGRGAVGNAVKSAGNVTKAAKAVKPVKVGVGRLKVGKN